MATPVSDLHAMLLREVNVPGFEQLPDLFPADLTGYVADGFWEAKLSGMLSDYTITDDGSGNLTIERISDSADLPTEWHVLVVMFAALKLIRLKALNLATNFKAVAGPVEYEQQVSATVLRAILEALERRVVELKSAHSELYGSALYYFDAVLQRESSMVQDLPALTVI